MTITKLVIYIAIFASLLLVVAMVRGKTKNLLVNWIQFAVGGLFIFSGVVKAIDPVGTAIKMEEYFEVFVEYTPALKGFWHFFAHQALAVSVLFIVLEIILGVTLLLGKYKKATVWLLLLIIIFFTFLTGFSHFEGKVTDCGCFGDFLKLTPWQSFLKDIVLTVLIVILFIGRKHIAGHYEEGQGNWVVAGFTLIVFWFTLSNYYDLPVKDFRAYKKGTDIKKCMTLPPDAKKPVIEITYIYRNKASGEEKEFVNSFPEDFQAWEYVDRKDKVIEKGDEPKCKDFIISDIDGNDVTQDILNMDGFVFVVTSFDLSRANRKGLESVTKVANEALAWGEGMTVIGITGSSLDDAEAVRHDLGLPITFYNLDAVPIKTMNRSNPGVVVLQKGTVIGKWHHRKAKSMDKMRKDIDPYK
jgi:hypothetical protein